MSKARRDKRQISRYMRQARTRRRKWFQRVADGIGIPSRSGRRSKWQQDFLATTASSQPEPKLTIESLNKVIEILKANQRPIVDGCYQFPADPSVPKEVVDQANAMTRSIMSRDQAKLKFGGFKPYDPDGFQFDNGTTIKFCDPAPEIETPDLAELKFLSGGCRSGKSLRDRKES